MLKSMAISSDSELSLRLITLRTGQLDREAGNVPLNIFEAKFKNSSLIKPQTHQG
jgi:hypothetical protein